MSGDRSEAFIPPHGGYAGQLAYQKALIAQKGNVSCETYETYIETRSPEVVANILICLIHQTNYLLDQLIRKLEKDFLTESGLRERMMRARLARRAKQTFVP
jgi:four helix bundle suffix protein